MPLAEQLGDAPYLRDLDPDHLETGSELHRRIYREHGSWEPVLQDMKQRWVQELTDAGSSGPATKIAIAG